MIRVLTVLLLFTQLVFAQWNDWHDAKSLRLKLLEAASKSKTYYSQFDWFAPRRNNSLNTIYYKEMNVQPLIYGVDFYYASGTYFPKQYIQVNRKNLISLVKSAWKEYKAIPLFSWHLENPYVTSDFVEMMGCRYRFSPQVSDYPRKHRYVIREILSSEGDVCGFGNRSRTDNSIFYINPRVWFEERIAEISKIIKELKDDDERPIPMIFRLWHECEDDWMWWGPSSVSAKDYRDFFILTENLVKKNVPDAEILWAYSPDRYWKDADFMKWYPGDEYVDIIGYDDYSIGKSRQDLSVCINRARFVSKIAKEKNKVAAIFETDNSHNETADVFFEDYLLKIVQDNETNLSLVQTWSTGKFSTIKQKNDRMSFLHNSSVIVWMEK